MAVGEEKHFGAHFDAALQVWIWWIRCVWGGYGADHFCVILIELCRYRVLYSFWDSGLVRILFRSTKGTPLADLVVWA